MRLLLDGIQHVRMITHEGKVLLVGIRKSGQLVYTIRRDGFEDDIEERQLDAWENWQPLPLPGVEGKDDDPSVHAREAKENVRQHADGTPLLDDEGQLQYLTRSLYDSRRSHRVTPIAVVSGMGHVHVFRVLRDPDPEGVVRPLPLLVDRFVLDGMANRLVPKLDLRFRRSRQRHEPLPSGPGSALVVDSLDFRDANDNPFTEPTTLIGFVDGRTGFSVELAPAGEPDGFNWHFATTDWRSSGQVTLTSVRAGEHGGFDLADGAGRPAIVRRVFGLSGYRIDGVPALQRFDRQAERRTASGETQWLRVATSLMLAVPVVPDAQDGHGDDQTRIVGTVQLPLRADGSLAPTAGESGKTETRLRGRERAVTLAPDTLLRARAVPISEKRGAVGILRRGEGGAIEIVAATSGDEDGDEPFEADAAVELELDGTPALDGVHVARGVELGKITRELRVGRKATYLAVRLQQGLPKGSRLRLGEHGFVRTTRDLRAGLRMLNLEVTDIGAPAGTPVFLADSFAITPPEGGLGTWQDASADAAARFDGQVLGMSMDEGRLIVHAPGHGLIDGDEVEIKGTRVFDGRHSAVRREDTFTLDRRWPASEAVNLKQQRVPRRGLVLGNGSTRILVDHGGLVDTDKDTTIEAWVRTTGDGVLLGWFPRAPEATRAAASDGVGEGMWLAISDGRLTLRAPDVPAVDGIADRRSVVDGQWHHVAAVFAEGVRERTVTFLVDGEASATMPLPSPLPSSRRNARLVMGARDADDVDALGAQGAELSEVRLWQRALTAEQLGEHLHRPVHHGSRDLAAYWRLGAVFDGDPPQVVDATIGRNDGDVIGPAWPTPVAVPRTMADGVTPVSRVENPALFGVAQGGVYREELQFRFRDGAGEVQFYLWGQASRSNSERVEFGADDVGTQISDPDEHGWATASVRFRVPDGVTLVRSMGIDVEGDWSALELRRHRAVFQESTTHESVVTSDLALTVVGEAHAGAASLSRRYEGLHGKKRALDQRLARLEGLLRSASEAAMRQSALAGLRIKERSLKHDIERTAAAIRRWENDPLSYWMTLFVLDDKLPSGNAPVGALADDPNGRMLIAIDKSELARDHAAGGLGEYMWRVELFFGGTNVQLINRSAGPGRRTLTAVKGPFFGFHLGLEFAALDAAGNGAQTYWITDMGFWRRSANRQERFSGRLRRSGWRGLRYSGSTPENGRHIGTFADAPENATIWGTWNGSEFVLVPTSARVPECERALKELGDRRRQARRQLDDVEREIAELEGLGPNRVAELTIQRDETRRHIDLVDQEIAIIAGQFELAASASASLGAAQSFAPADDEGLPASGAVLAHAEATSEVSLFASATGDVILSYVDARGQVRQSRYDAAAGSDDATVEQWIADGLRRGLVRGDGAVLPRGTTDGLWTLEAWMQFPLREGQRLLVSRPDSNGEWEGIGVLDGKLGVRTRDEVEGGTDLSRIGREDDSPKPPLHWISLDVTLGEVPVGWHHVAVVAGSDLPVRTLRFYIDGLPHGSPLGVATTKTAEDQMVVAPTLPTEELRIIDVGEGIAQVRLWDVALDLEEVQTSSRVVLTGREPGLVAFHPLDGDLADPVLGTTLEVGKPVFGPCTAPIGNPGQRVAVFDGTRRHDFTAFFQSGSRTVETWLRFKPDVVHAQVIFATSVHVSEGWGRFVLYLTDARDDGQQELAAVVLVEGQERRSRVELVADGVWHHVAAMVDYAGGVRLLVDGEEGSAGDELKPTSFALPLDVRDGGIGIIGGGIRGKELRTGFQGELAEMRAWDGERRRIELKRFRHQRAPQGFVRRWAFDEPGTPGAPARLVNDLPIGDTDVRVAEYPTYGLDRVGRRLAIMRRCTAVSAGDGIDLWAQQRVEALDLVWIGNAQFQPTLLGYIEGAPPVPSENLTVDPESYNEATSVTVSMAEELELSWNRSEETTHGFGMDFFIGYENEWEVGANAPLLGRLLSWEAGGLRAGLAASFALDKTEAYETNIAATSAVTRSDTLSLRGFAEDEPAFPELGPRFVPKNVGYALVVAGLADVFVSRLATSGRMVGYQIIPVSDVPPDVSTITFLINPAYTLNGSLDGQTGMQATSERFFAHVPEARRQFGSRYPASYFRLAEAYALREQIRDDDKRREAFFENFIIDASASEDTIAAQIDDPDFTPREIAVEREEGKPSPAAKTAKGAEDEKIGLGDLGDEASGKADEAAEQVEDIKEKIEAESDKKKALVEAKKKEIERLSRPEQREHATSSFRVWQRKMEDLKVRAGKRNIVNSYVWDADGGLRVESEEFASTVEHTVGSALNMEWALGADIALNVSGFQLELSPMYQGSLSQTMSKTRTASSALSLEVDLSGVECQGITDFKDRPIMPGVKVDRYRFMTFYLDGSERNFDEFFNYVVDPEWLASNDEEARALRQAMAGGKGKPWRVMHRVTQVERPALSGFGEDTRPLPKVEQPSELEQRLSAIESQLKLLAADHRPPRA